MEGYQNQRKTRYDVPANVADWQADVVGPSSVAAGVEDMRQGTTSRAEWWLVRHPKFGPPKCFAAVAVGLGGRGEVRYLGERGDPEGAGSHLCAEKPDGVAIAKIVYNLLVAENAEKAHKIIIAVEPIGEATT